VFENVVTGVRIHRNAQTLLEGRGLVVAEVDGRSDYGRDLMVDITEGNEITGAVIGVQVKGDRRFVCAGDWELLASPKDLRYWAESSVPVVGVIWDSDSGELRWKNLTEYARTDPAISTWPPKRPSQAQPLTERAVSFPKDHALNVTTAPQMIGQMRTYLRQISAPALLGLFDADDERRCHAVFDCWTVWRSDARAFHLLRRALPSLRGKGLLNAIVILSHLTPHPDILWHANNWVPPEIEEEVQPTFRWSHEEVCDLVCAVEDCGWERGSIGQCLWMLLIQDPDLKRSTLPAIGLAVARDELEAAFRLLLVHQYLAKDALAATRKALVQHPALATHELANELLVQIAESGRVSLW
jgi:hypothetical protein